MSLIGRLLGRQKTRWPESWHTFPGTISFNPALWSVDLGAVDAAPIAGLPYRLDVTAPFAAGTDGLPIAPLAEAEDVVRRVVDAVGGAYLGCVASQGRGRFTAHLPTQPAEQITVPELPGAEVAIEYDPHWAYVRDTLAPDVRQHRLLADRDLVGQLAAEGDKLGTARDVAHVAFFAAGEPAELAAADLRARGFSATVEPDGEGEFALTAIRSDPVAPPRVHELTWEVQETVERHGGMYDGWSCAVAA